MPEEEEKEPEFLDPMAAHFANLIRQLEGESEDGRKLVLGGVVTVVEFALVDEEGDPVSTSVLARYRGAGSTAVGLLRLGEENIREGLNRGATLESTETPPTSGS